MTDVYQELMLQCRVIADAFPQPCFYEECAGEIGASRKIFAEDKSVLHCLDIVAGTLENNLGHGLDHVEKVAVEAGALALREQKRMQVDDRGWGRMIVLAQLAGLLHDLRRGEKDHAKKSSVAGAVILDGLPVSDEEKVLIVEAIANHEAFATPTTPETIHGQVLSDILYDADKFRWGADNFTLTLWEMLRSRPIPISAVIQHFPDGMAGILRIRGTFRSETGKVFGPEFIDLGLEIGERVYQYLKKRSAKE